MHRFPHRAGSATGPLALLAVLCLPLTARAGATIAIMPATQTVAPGATFDVTIVVTPTAGTKFNAVQLRMGFDPAKLTWLGSLSSYGNDAYLLTVHKNHHARSLADLP